LQAFFVCQRRTLPSFPGRRRSGRTRFKKKLQEEIEKAISEEIHQVVTRLSGWIGMEEESIANLDLESVEFFIRKDMHELGRRVLEKFLRQSGKGYQGASIRLEDGSKAKFAEYRTKTLQTVLGPITLERAYYHSRESRKGFFPLDSILGVEGCSRTPGFRRLVSRVGGQTSFIKGSEDLLELAEIEISPREIGRISQAVGEEILGTEEDFRERVFGGDGENVVSLLDTGEIEKAYFGVDGTGIPVVVSETIGRKGKGKDGKARTREVKLGCVFTQTSVDEEGRPVRDEGSTSYVGKVETADEVGRELYAEVERRGLSKAKEKIVLGDGAKWIWELAQEHFPEATQIVDFFHACEHLWTLGRALFPKDEKKMKRWVGSRRAQLEKGDIASLLKAFDRIEISGEKTREVMRIEREYFRNNRKRMRYKQFRENGLFIGSGVVEAGCKSVIGQRLKQSGMRWTLAVANPVIAIRRRLLGGEWNDYWAERADSRNRWVA